MRKGFLASAALALGSSAAQAQYYPAYPTPNQAPMPQYGNYRPAPQPVYYYPQAPMQMARPGVPVMPAGRSMSPTYLPQNYFPTNIIREAPTYVNVPSPATTSSSPQVTIINETPAPPVMMQAQPMPSAPVVRSVGKGPAAYFDVVPSGPSCGSMCGLPLTHAPVAPVEYCRKCKDSWWFGADYIMSWMREGPLSTPLLTTSTNDDPNADRGSLGEPGTIVLFGGEGLKFGLFSGVRLEAGVWLDSDNRYSVDASGFFLFPRHVGTSYTSDGSLILGRPFFNVANGQNDEDVQIIADHDANGRAFAGRIDIDSKSQVFGGEINGRWHGYWGKHLHTECLIGLRSLRLVERLSIKDAYRGLIPGLATFEGDPIGDGDIISESDSFDTENTFIGFQLGGRVRYEAKRFYMDAFAKVGLGLTYQQLTVAGESKLLSGGQVVDTAPGGVLAVPSNIGNYDRTRFGIVPEVGMNIGVEVTDHIRLKAGYSFLLLSGAARPGQQIDRLINAGQIPGDQDYGAVAGQPGPRRFFNEQVFWLHTLNFGFEVHY